MSKWVCPHSINIRLSFVWTFMPTPSIHQKHMKHAKCWCIHKNNSQLKVPVESKDDSVTEWWRKLLKIVVANILLWSTFGSCGYLQVLILRACNNLASKLGLEKGANQRWFEFLQTLKEDQWRQGQLGRDARDILIETSMWVDVHLTTTNEDMAKAIWSLKRVGKDDIDRGLSNWKSDNVPTGKGRRGWDKAFRLESAEEVSGWDELFKLASGSEKSFPEFLDDYDYEDPSSSSSSPPMAALAVPDLKQHLWWWSS